MRKGRLFLHDMDKLKIFSIRSFQVMALQYNEIPELPIDLVGKGYTHKDFLFSYEIRDLELCRVFGVLQHEDKTFEVIEYGYIKTWRLHYLVYDEGFKTNCTQGERAKYMREHLYLVIGDCR